MAELWLTSKEAIQLWNSGQRVSTQSSQPLHAITSHIPREWGPKLRDGRERGWPEGRYPFFTGGLEA